MIENFDNKYLQSFEYETTAISDGNIIGTCELGKATIQMINASNEYSSLKGQWIKTIHGSFYIHSVEPVQEKVNIKLSCYDVKYKLDTSYDSSLYTWPMTLKEWRNAIFTNCGVYYDDTYFPNNDLILEKEPYIGDNPSNRNVISLIAQAACSWVDTDNNDIFYFRWFDEISYTVDDWLELTTEKELSNPINVVVLGRGDVEDNVKWPKILPENPSEIRIDNNYILDSQNENDDKRYDVIEPIYDRVNGFSYLIFNMRTQQISNKLNVKLGQKISFKDLWENELNAYIMSKKITWLGGEPTNSDNYEISLSAEKMNETTTEYSYASSIDNRLIKVERTADKQNGEIKDLVSSTKIIGNQITPTAKISDSSIHIEDSANEPLVCLEIEGKSEQEIRSGKNYINSFKFAEKTASGMTGSVNDDGSIKLSGTTTALTNFWLTMLNEKLEPGAYKFVTNINLTGKGRYTLIDNTSGSNVNIMNNTKTHSFTITEDATLTTIMIQINANVTLNDDFYIMLIKDSETEDYEKYGASPSPDYPSEIKSIGKYNGETGKYEIGIKITNETNTNTSLIVLDEPLRGLKNEVKDIAYIKNNKLYVERHVKSIVLDGSEKWVLSGNVFYTDSISDYTRDVFIPMTNYFNGVESKNAAVAMNVNNTLAFGNVSTNNRLYIRCDKFTTVDDFALWLSKHPVQVNYELANPITEEIGKLEMPSTYKGLNNITTTDELEPVINIEYVRDTTLSNYVEGQIGNAVAIQEQKNAEFSITADRINSRVSDISTTLNNDYTNNEELEQKLEEQKSSITTEMTTMVTQTKEKVTTEVITKINQDGVEMLKNTLVTINQDGINVSKSDDDVVSLLDNKGLYVSDGTLREDNSNLLMKTDRSGAYFKTIETMGTIKENGLIQKEKIIHEKYGVCQAWYWVGD